MAEAIVTGVFRKGSPPVRVAWRDGEVTGDGAAIAYLDSLIATPRTVTMTPTGPWFSSGDARTDGWAFIATVRSFLGEAHYTHDGLPRYAPPVTDRNTVS